MEKRFGTTMKDKREEINITQTELAKAIGKSPQLICDIEAGRKNPGRNTLVAIAKKLGISLDDIFLS